MVSSLLLLVLVLALCGRGSGLAISSSVTFEGDNNQIQFNDQEAPTRVGPAPFATIDHHTHHYFYDAYKHHHHNLGLFAPLPLQPTTTNTIAPTTTTTTTTTTHIVAGNTRALNAGPSVRPAPILSINEPPPVQGPYQGRVGDSIASDAPSSAPSAGDIRDNLIYGSDSNVSPYWADPGDRAPSPLPSVVPEDLAPNTQACRELPGPCNVSYPYRTISGRCNNLQRPHLGTSGQPMVRVLPPVYDGAWMRLRSGAGGLLPHPRRVSLGMRDAPQGVPTTHNQLVMQMGQFIDHDLSVVPTLKGPTQSPGRRCEGCDSWIDPHCAPLPIPTDDSYLRAKDHLNTPLCLPFVRSEAIKGRDSLGRPSIEQLSLNTAFLDLSTVYSSDHCREKYLRFYSFGMLTEVAHERGRGGFPIMRDAEEFEECRAEGDKCFFVGDERSNEHLGLMVSHVLFFREHNRLALELASINPHWDDEKLYQEARRINIAEFQHFIYSQFLPEILGRDKMEDYRLHPETTGYYQGYDSSSDPSILNEFSTAAFRVGHTMVPDELLLLDANFLPRASLPIANTFHNATMTLLPDMCDQVVRGLIGARLEPVDLNVVKTLSNKLFEGPRHLGQDLIARNIARGRDHGLPPYVQYREACGGSVTSSFDDLLSVMPRQAVSTLARIYARVEDVDLFVGGMAEYPVSGGLVGPTFACLIGYQFFNLRRGDRFWYENPGAGFSHSQLRAIRVSSTLNRILCSNMDDRDGRLPVNVFHLPSKRGNPLVPCDRVTPLDLTPWREHSGGGQVECSYLGHVYPPGRPVHASPCLLCQCHEQGMMRCQPNPSGCQQPDQDEHCKLIC